MAMRDVVVHPCQFDELKLGLPSEQCEYFRENLRPCLRHIGSSILISNDCMIFALVVRSVR